MSTPTVRERIAEIIEPLQQEAAKLDTEIREQEAKLAALKDDRRQLAAVLQRATGEPAKKPGPKQPATAKVGGSDKWLPTVRDHIAAMGEAEFSIKAVYESLRDDADKRGVTNLKERPGYESVKRAMATMHASGELRIVRKVQGGNALYSRTTKGE